MKIIIGLLLVSLCFVNCKKNNLPSPIQDDLTENNKATNPHFKKHIPQVKIGKQTWMAENLDVSTYANGDPIPQVTDESQWGLLTTGAWCYYNNDPFIGTTYGKLYNWYAVNDPRGLAPEGWHIPSVAEWETLGSYLGGDDIAGGKMKERGTTHWLSPNTGATNSSRFTGLPGAFRDGVSGWFVFLGEYGNFWTSTEYEDNNFAQFYFLYNKDTYIVKSYFEKGEGISVRCIKN